ncbi:MAG: EAL domain-containing protein, partial [Culicoidibacterales bacterium]
QAVVTTHESQTFSDVFSSQMTSTFLQVYKSPLFDNHNQFVGIFGFAQDFSNLKTLQNKLQITLDSLPMGACIRDIHGEFIYFNELFANLYNHEIHIGQNIFEELDTLTQKERNFIYEKDQIIIQTGKPIIYQSTVQIQGEKRIIEFTKSPIFDLGGEVIQILLLLRDVTESVEQEARVHRLAFQDPITNLANRSGLFEMLGQKSVEKADDQAYGALFLIDILNFKRYNEHFGHDFGNLLLKEYASRLTQLKPTDFISRDSDEFTIFTTFDTEPSSEKLQQYAAELLTELNRPLVLGNSSYDVDLRMSFDFMPLTEDLVQTVSHCELALTIAKESTDQKITAYNPDLIKKKQDHEQFLLKFEFALLNEEIELFYQPQYTCQNKLIGFEGLFRWPNNNFPQYNVGQIIGFIEKTPMIHQLGAYVLEKAMKFAYEINQNRTELLTVGVNLSAYQIMSPNFVEIIETFIEKYQIKPGMLDLEITETSLMEDFETNIVKFKHLKSLGFKISLDDFGTGYSSLNYLANLPLSTVKIDQSFIRQLSQQTRYQTLVRLIIDAAHSLDLEVIAEGVETQAELEILENLHADYIQGYYFSKPLPEKQAYALTH